MTSRGSPSRLFPAERNRGRELSKFRKIIPPSGYASRIFKYSMRHRIGVTGAGVFECEKGKRRRWPASLGEITNDPSVSETFRKAATNTRERERALLFTPRSFYFCVGLFGRRSSKFFAVKVEI